MPFYYKLLVAYDGTRYAGWQVQPHAVAVANILESTFLHVFSKPVKIIGASRTDAGVHALGQVALVITDLHLDPATMMRAWNNALPGDIVIRSLCSSDETFHPQRAVKQKIYWYHIFNQRPLPFLARYGYALQRPCDDKKLYEALQIFVGEHDFRSFCTGDEQITTTRRIDAITIHFFKRFNACRIEVQGPGFLRYMIRRIVGASVEVASRRSLSIDYVRTILEAKNPEHSLPNAPAQGLMLAKIIYNNCKSEM